MFGKVKSRPTLGRRIRLVVLVQLLAFAASAQESVPLPPDLPGQLPGEGSPISTGTSLANPTQWRSIVIHHSATPSGSAADFDRMHRRKGWEGLGYHFVIDNGKGGPDGRLEVGARWWQQKHGAHAGGLHGESDPDARNEFNEFGIGVCLVGNLDRAVPTKRQMETLARLVERLRERHGIGLDAVLGHRHVRQTACPGRRFSWGRLYGMLGESAAGPAPRQAIATWDRCDWCWRSDSGLAEHRGIGPLPPSLPPTPALFRPGF